MTQKELLYVEDAVGHEQNLDTITKETIKLLQDKNLKIFMGNQLQIHQNIKEKLMNLLKEELGWMIKF